MTDMKIPLTQGKYALIDEADFGLVSDKKWCADKANTGDNYYATTSMGRKHIRMHRLIMDAKKGEHTDHINGDTLDNRRSNLRICTHAENCRNQHVRNRGTSQYKGVSWSEDRRKWLVQIKVNYKTIPLGRFRNEIYAAGVYDKAAVKYFGEYANLNFKQGDKTWLAQVR